MQSARRVAIQTALEAGRLLLDRFGRVRDVRHKGLVDLVTEADDASERHILRRLRDAFPNDAFLAEEAGASDQSRMPNGRRWIVDPLDGTTNFAHGYPVFGISIALEIDAQVALGVVYVPALSELFVAERGRGAWLNGEPVAVSRTDALIRALVATGFEYDPARRGRNLVHWGNFVHATQGTRRDGAAAINLCYVGCGRFDGYWEEGLSLWDSAAGALVVVEGGGTVTQYGGEPYRADARTCVATNGRLHDQMLAVIGADSADNVGAG